MIDPGYVVQVEAWFDDDEDGTIYDRYCDLTSEDRDHKVSGYTEINYLGSGYDYVHFYRKRDAQSYIKRLIKIGIPEHCIGRWTINSVKGF